MLRSQFIRSCNVYKISADLPKRELTADSCEQAVSYAYLRDKTKSAEKKTNSLDLAPISGWANFDASSQVSKANASLYNLVEF